MDAIGWLILGCIDNPTKPTQTPTVDGTIAPQHFSLRASISHHCYISIYLSILCRDMVLMLRSCRNLQGVELPMNLYVIIPFDATESAFLT